MNKQIKNIIFSIAGLLLLFVLFFVVKFYFSDTKNLKSIYLIPKDAIYFVSSDKPIKNWETVRDSKLWQHLQTNTYFAELTANANTIDSVLNENKKLFDLLGSKKLLVSTHPISKYKYDYFFVVDLDKTAQFLQFKTLIKKLFSDDYTFTERMYKEVEIMELFDKKTRETLHLSIINNNLIASYTHTLVEAAISQLNEPTIGRDLKFVEINNKLKNDKLFQLYIQYNYVDEFTRILMNSSEKWVNDLSKILVYSGFDLDLVSGTKVVAKGVTNTNDNAVSYLQALQNSGLGKQSIAKVAPHRTSMYFSLGFENFSKFYENYTIIQQKNQKAFKEVESKTKQIEKFLDISIKDNFINWIDNEVALLKLEPISQSKNADFALVFKTKSAVSANENLDFILKQIKKKTPVKFKAISYKGYPIKFMAIKGFFKVFLGGYFSELETPYYTLIDDYVVFSNHPNTLKYIITNYTEKNTLNKATNYKEFISNFSSKSNLFVYINTPMLYESLLTGKDISLKKQLIKNKTYFTSFSQIGIQLMPKDNIFKSKLIIQYKDQESIQYSDEFKALTIGPMLEGSNLTNPIVVRDNQDPMEILKINPSDLNAKEFTKLYPNGELQVRVPLKDGQKHGIYKEYYKNGETRIKGRFKNDKRTGTWRKYDTNGKVVLKVKY